MKELPLTLVLCGGLGTRLKSVVDDRPKGMAEVAGRPFLDILLDSLSRQGVKRFLLLTGYMAEQIEAHFADRPEVRFSREPEPLGTGGAIKWAEREIDESEFLVLNGDSHCEVDLADFAAFHRKKDSWMSIALSYCDKPQDYGLVSIDAEKRIADFSEKSRTPQPGWINAGIYLMNRKVLAAMPTGAFSLEKDFIPKQIVEHRCFGYLSKKPVLDIGTPERFQAAQTFHFR